VLLNPELLTSPGCDGAKSDKSAGLFEHISWREQRA